MWPKRGWGRAFRYYSKRVLRMTGTPHNIAIGFASGVALSMTPFIGFHYILSIVTAFLARGNILAAMLATAVGNPLTFPFIWFATFETGNLILGWFGSAREAPNFDKLAHHLLTQSFRHLWPIIEPMLIGSIPIGLALGAISYVLVYLAARSFQHARRERFAVRRRELHGLHS